MILQYLYGQGPREDIFGSEKSAGEIWTPASFLSTALLAQCLLGIGQEEMHFMEQMHG